MDSTFNHDSIQSKNLQYGGKSLQQLRDETYSDVQALFACSLNGGLLGIRVDTGLPVEFISDPLLDNLKLTYAHFMELYHGNLIETILPEYQSDYLDAVRYAFTHDTIFDFTCQVHTEDGHLCWVRDVGKVHSKNKEIFIILRSDITHMFMNHDELAHRARIYEEKSRELGALAASIPGGVSAISVNDETYTVMSANAGFYSLFCYTPRQLKEEQQNHMTNLIYAKDRPLVHDAVRKARTKCTEIFEFEHRAVKRNNDIIWLLVRGSFSDPNDSSLFNCVVIDITERKKMEKEARINEKRFRIALSQTDSSIFDYDIRTHIMLHGDRSALQYGLQQYTENVPWSLVDDGIVHQDTAADFLDMYERITNGAPSASCHIKTRLSIGNYVWRKITMTTIYDESGTPVQAIGILEDIDEQVRREEALRYQSERDPLTGIYNRRATLTYIDANLKTRKSSCIGALLILDLDDFKNVNDHYGHRFGDYVLKECATRIPALFRKDEIVGRIGGDEFIIFANNLPSASVAVNCAQRIVKTFKQPFTFLDTDLNVSCSIGVAIVPNDGEVFDELYQKADIALYEAKNKGKNAIAIYREDMNRTTEWIPYSNTEIDT